MLCDFADLLSFYYLTLISVCSKYSGAYIFCMFLFYFNEIIFC